MQSIDVLLAQHPFFKDLSEEYLKLIAGCATNQVYEAGQYLFQEGEEATQFFIVRHGKIAIEARIPTQREIIIYTHDANDVVGWAWLFPPYHWRFSGRAVELTRVTALDGICLRDKCEKDPLLGYEFLKRFSHKVVYSLYETRLQLLDLYGVQPASVHR